MTKTQIKIEMIHDVVCSWCPIGYRNMKAALKLMEGQFETEFVFLPFELNPSMPPEGETIKAHLARRNGWSSAQLARYRDSLVQTAAKAGLTYNFSKRTHYWNTAMAHSLLHVAEKFGKQEQVNEALIQGYFADGMKVDDLASLAEVADSVGLDASTTLAALGSPQVAAEMRAKRQRVSGLNIRSVPTFVVNGSDFLPGSNSVEFFAQYLSEVRAKSLRLAS